MILCRQVILCDSGQQAVDKAKQLQMDLILMDIQMPDMDGIRACGAYPSPVHHQQTPVIAVTAHALEGLREKFTERRHERLSGEAQSKKRNCTHCCCAISPACTASFRRRYRPQSRSSIIIKRSTGSWRCARRP
ncbi:BarA sensory histidine kinase [Klebsiella pneumoniae]|uniref:BarA sensory histidine kinase n=1 Tax=Klebsiella pneumoniae TaxID=573 RepID=A0A377VVS0_KLEPN|nr:BarA sensory histidine kinase [Klebsiella pneumoniae]